MKRIVNTICLLLFSFYAIGQGFPVVVGNTGFPVRISNIEAIKRSPVGLPLPLFPVAGKLVMPQQLFYTGSESAITYRTVHNVTRPTTVIRFLWQNQSNSGVASNSFTLKASVQGIPTTATNIGSVALNKIRFNGIDSVVIAAGDYVISDPMWLSVLPVDGAYFLVRTLAKSSAASGQNKWPVGLIVAGGNNGTATGDQTMNLGATFTSGTTGLSPGLIVSKSEPGQEFSLLGAGDSIMDGANDVTTNRGYFGMLIENNSVSGNRIAVPGEQLNFVMGAANMMRYRWIYGQSSTHVISAYCTNDIFNNIDLATNQSNLIKWWSYWSLMGKKVMQTTILPRNTSTDNWRTVGNQSTQAQETVRVALNQWLLDGAPCIVNGYTVTATTSSDPNKVPCPYLTRVLNINSVVEVNSGGTSQTNGGRWKSGAVLRTGAITSATSNTMVDASGNFNSLSVPGTLVVITGGTGAGQVNYVVGNPSGSNTQLNMKSNWGTIPDATSTYQILDVMTDDGIHLTTNGHKLIATFLGSMLPDWKKE